MAVRMSAFPADVTRKKCFILFPLKRVILAQIFHQTKNVSAMLWREKHFVKNVLECVGSRYFFGLNIVDYKRCTKFGFLIRPSRIFTTVVLKHV